MNVKYKIGNLVSVLDDIIKGRVVAVEKYVITIEDENGFLFHYQPKELVLINDRIFDNITIEHNSDEVHKIKAKTKLKSEKSVLEVDLHIHEITHSNSQLNNFEMLTIQLDFAKQKIDYAIKNKISKIIFIHGIGQGVLKAELLQLFKNYPIEINDANYKKYGKGATEVRIFLSKT